MGLPPTVELCGKIPPSLAGARYAVFPAVRRSSAIVNLSPVRCSPAIVMSPAASFQNSDNYFHS